MESMNIIILEVFIVLCSLTASGRAGEYCLSDGGLSLSYCTYKCCGDSPYHYCCGIYWWIIVAAVVGGVIFFTCVGCFICWCVAASQGGGNKGRVVQPAPGNTNITTMAYNPGVQPNYGFNQPQPPVRNPAYNQYPPVYQPNVPAPSYDAVYPPPPPPPPSNHPPPTASSSRSSSASSRDSPKKNKRK